MGRGSRRLPSTPILKCRKESNRHPPQLHPLRNWFTGMTPILQVEKLRPREMKPLRIRKVKQLAQGHADRKWQKPNRTAARFTHQSISLCPCPAPSCASPLFSKFPRISDLCRRSPRITVPSPLSFPTLHGTLWTSLVAGTFCGCVVGGER